MPILAKSFISFFHPVLMSGTLIGAFYALYLGIQTRRTRNAPSEARKQLIKGKYGLKHFYSGSGLLTFWVIGSLIGMAATYYSGSISSKQQSNSHKDFRLCNVFTFIAGLICSL